MAFSGADYFESKGDLFTRLESGEVYVASHKKGRLGCTLNRLPLIKKGDLEAVEEPLMHKIVTLNHELYKENPLFNESILLFTMFDSGRGVFPLVVGEHSPAELYLMERFEPCTLQGDGIVKEKQEEAQSILPVEKKTKTSSQGEAAKDKKIEEKKEEPAPCELLSSGVLKDAHGNPAGHIVALERINSTLIAVAVAPQGSVFGDPGSGIALVQLVEESVQQEKDAPKMVRFLKQISVEGLAGKDVIRSCPLDCSSSAITFGGVRAASFGQHVSFHWDKHLERLFIGLDVMSADDAQAQTAAVVVARIEYDEEELRIIQQQKTKESSKHSKKTVEKEQEPIIKRILHAKLFFEPIVSRVTLDEHVDYIVTQKGSRTRTVIDQLKTLWTGTHIPHLIVLRRDAYEKDKASLFALPLVSGKSFELGKERKKIMNDAGKVQKIAAKEGSPEYKKQAAFNEVKKKMLEDEAHKLLSEMQILDSTRGTLASVNQGVETFFFDTHPYTLEDRRLSLEAVNAYDLFTLQNEAANVGGGPLTGYIHDITIRGDSVEVTVYTQENTKEVYISRPLLNSDGMIEHWTLWRPLNFIENALPSDSVQTQRSYCDGQHAPCMVTIEQKDGVEVHKRVKNTNKSQEPLREFASKVNDEFKGHTMLGAREIVISQPYAEQEVVVCAYSTKQLAISSLDRYQKSESIVTYQFPCEMKSVRGIAVASVVDSKILFVGGYDGLYALIDPQGNGWPIERKINSLSIEECEAFSFVRIGNNTRIRSLISDGQFLYVLTNKTFERIDLLASSFCDDGEIVSNTLAASDSLPGHGARDIFLDCVVSDKLALLATTRGLFRSGDRLDIRDISDEASCSWVRINVPCQEGPIVQLVPLSSTGLATDCACYGGGELYVLNSYSGYNTTRVTRYHIADCSRNEVSAETVQLLPDRFMKNEETTFIRLNDYTNSLVVDGGSCLLVHPVIDARPSCLYRKEFSAEKTHGDVTRFTRNPLVFELAKDESIVSAALSIATGKILVTTTQGLRILE